PRRRREVRHATAWLLERRRWSGHRGAVLALLVAAALVLAALLWVGVRLLWAGRQLDEATPEGAARIPVAPDGSVAAKVDSRLQRARARVETLVMIEVDHEELRPSVAASRDRAQTYAVLGL